MGWVDEELERWMEVVKRVVDACLAARQRLGVKRRWPLVKLSVIPQEKGVAEAVEGLKELVKSQCNTLEVEVLPPGEEVREAELVAVPEMSSLGKEFRALAPKVAEAIARADAASLCSELESSGAAEVEVEGERVVLRREHVRFAAGDGDLRELPGRGGVHRCQEDGACC